MKKSSNLKPIHKNIKYLREAKFNMTQDEFAALLDVKRARLGSWEEGRVQTIKTLVLNKLIDLCKEKDIHISLDMLYSENLRILESKNPAEFGKFNVRVRELIITSDETDKQNIELVDTESGKAAAGYLNGLADPEYIRELPRFQLPFLTNNATYRAFRIKGQSMLPLPSGSIVVGEYIDNFNDIKNGETYVVVSKEEGVVYKRVYNQIEKNGQLLLTSDNPDPEYQPYTISANEVKEVWRARHFIVSDTISGDTVWEKLLSEIAHLRAELRRLNDGDDKINLN